MNKTEEAPTSTDPIAKLRLMSKLFLNNNDSKNPDNTIDIEVANPLWILSEYLTTIAMTNPVIA